MAKQFDVNLLSKEKKKKSVELESRKKFLENQVKNIKEKIGTLKSQLDTSLQAEKIVKDLEEEIKKLDLLEEFSKNLSQRKETELKLASLEKELESIEEVTKILEEFEEKHTKFIKNKELERQVSKERKKYEGSDSLWKKSVQDLKKMEKDRNKLGSLLEKILDNYQGIFGTKVTVENVYSLLDENKTKLKTEIEQIHQKLDDIKSKIAVLKKRKSDLEYNLSKLDPSDPSLKTCPMCETELSKDRVIQLGQDFNAEKSQIPNQIEKFNEQLEILDQTMKELEKARDKINAIEPERISELSREIIEAKCGIDDKKNEINELEAQALLFKELDSKLSEIEKEIAELEEPNLKFESASRQLQRLRTREKIEDEIEPLNAELKEANSLLKKAITQTKVT